MADKAEIGDDQSAQSPGPSGAGPNDTATTSRRILIGLVVGTLLGVALNLVGPHPWRETLFTNVINPMGIFFLRTLFVIVVPLVFTSLSVGVARLGSGSQVTRMGWRLLVYYLGTTLLAASIGLTTAARPRLKTSRWMTPYAWSKVDRWLYRAPLGLPVVPDV